MSHAISNLFPMGHRGRGHIYRLWGRLKTWKTWKLGSQLQIKNSTVKFSNEQLPAAKIFADIRQFTKVGHLFVRIGITNELLMDLEFGYWGLGYRSVSWSQLEFNMLEVWGPRISVGLIAVAYLGFCKGGHIRGSGDGCPPARSGAEHQPPTVFLWF